MDLDTFTPEYHYVFKFILQKLENNLDEEEIAAQDLFHELIGELEDATANEIPFRDYLLSFPPSIEELQGILEEIKQLHHRLQTELGKRSCEAIFHDPDLVILLNLIEERIENFGELRDEDMRAPILEELTKYGYTNHDTLLNFIALDMISMGSEKTGTNRGSLALDYLTEKYRQDISPEVGKVSKEEIFSASTHDQRIADDLILNFAQSLSNFSSWEEINIGIQILHVAMHEFGFNQNISENILFERYCTHFPPFELEDFKRILGKMKSKRSIALFRIHMNGLSLTDTSFFVYDNYQRMKAELLSAKKSGSNERLARLFLFFRNYIINSSDGIETDWLFNAKYLLEQAMKSISEGGEELIYSEKFYPQLNKIHDLIERIILYERDNSDSNVYSIQAYVEIQTELDNTIRAMLIHAGTRLGAIFKTPDILLKRTPFPTMERVFIDSMDDGVWDRLFLRDPACAWPIQLLMGFNSNTLEKNILALVSDAPKDHISDLPTTPPDGMQACPLSDAMVKDEAYNLVKKELQSLAAQNQQGLDYELVKNKNPVKFFSKLASFYQLVGEGGVDLDPTIHPTRDEDNSVRHFTARRYFAINQEEVTLNE